MHRLAILDTTTNKITNILMIDCIGVYTPKNNEKLDCPVWLNIGDIYTTEKPAELVKSEKKAEIENRYKDIFDSLAKDLGLALLANNTTAQDTIKKDYADAQAAYKTELGAL